MQCSFCDGVAHPATGCQYTPTMIACNECTRRFWTWVKGHTNGKASRRNRRPGFEPTLSFYEAAGKSHDEQAAAEAFRRHEQEAIPTPRSSRD